jgi:hypothetical protein
MVSNFLQAAPASAVTLLTTELNALASGAAATSSVGGTSGVFTESSTSSYLWGDLVFNPGGAFGSAPAAGGYLAGWFLRSPDGGSTFETVVATPSLTQPALPRSPDFVIPIDAATGASGDLKWGQGRTPLPYESYKVLLQNMTSQALAATGNTLRVLPITNEY